MSLIAPFDRSTLALAFLRQAELTMRHEPILVTKTRNTALVNLASESATSASGRPAPERRRISPMIVAVSVAVAVGFALWARRASGPTRNGRGPGSCRNRPPPGAAQQSGPDQPAAPRRQQEMQAPA